MVSTPAAPTVAYSGSTDTLGPVLNKAGCTSSRGPVAMSRSCYEHVICGVLEPAVAGVERQDSGGAAEPEAVDDPDPVRPGRAGGGQDRPVEQLRGGLRGVRVIGGTAGPGLKRPGVGAAFLRRVTRPAAAGDEHGAVGGDEDLRAGEQGVAKLGRRVPAGRSQEIDHKLGAGRGDDGGYGHSRPRRA